MSSKFFFILGCLALLGGTVFYRSFSPKDEKITIGILQTASHFALDQVRENFIQELNRLMNDGTAFIIQNAEGSLSQAQTIAENFHAHRKIDALFAIGTPAVQAAARVEKRKPVFLAAISDPESLGILYEGSNVCGITDRINTEQQADFILQILPGIQRIAILYNPGESNSFAMVKKMEKSLEKRGVENIAIGVNSESEIGSAVLSATRKAEAILIPADNLLAGAMPRVAKEALKRKCPLIVSDLHYLNQGALAAQGTDYDDQGKKAAEIAFRVLSGNEKPYQIGIVDPSHAKTGINEKVFSQLEISVPERVF